MVFPFAGRLELPNPVELVAALDRVVVGQTEAKRALALAAYRHYLGIQRRGAADHPEFGPQHVLLLGPTGCGKTELVRELAKQLRVPVAMVSATSYVEAGYSGDHVENIVRGLYQRTDDDIESTERGMIFVDEIDKTRSAPELTRDVSGTGVQNALLKLMDGISVPVKHADAIRWVNTSRVFFVFAGAFEGIRVLADRRDPAAAGIGFRQVSPSTVSAGAAIMQRTSTDDLIHYGLVREFVGRMTTIAEVEALTVNELERILVEPHGAWLKRMTSFFATHGAELSVSQAALRAIAEAAAREGTGARALHRVATAALEPTIWRFLRSERAVARIRVTRETVEDGARARFDFATGEQARTLLVERPPPPPGADSAPPARSGPRTAAWHHVQLSHLEHELHLADSSPASKLWWQRIRTEHAAKPRELREFAEQLRRRGANIDELFRAHVLGETDDLGALLHYIDYRRLRDAEVSRRNARP